MPITHSTDLNVFAAILQNNDIPHPVYYEKAPGYSLKGRNPFSSYGPPKYQLDDIPWLVSRLSFYQGADRSLEDYAIRYVIDNDAHHTPYFSLEGKENGDVSAHERLSSKCLAAGLLRFEKYGEHIVLTGIDHDSGYFQPTQDSLIWPLKMLLSTQIFLVHKQLQLFCREGDAQTCFTLNAMSIFERVRMMTPRIRSFASEQSCSDSYEKFDMQLQQEPEKAAAQVSTSVKKRKLISPESEVRASALEQLQNSLNALHFSHNSAFTLWQPKPSAKAVSALPAVLSSS